MTTNAVARIRVRPRPPLVPLALLVSAALFVGLGSTATARPLSKDGQIHACYRVKGKPKGALRVVPSARAHCRRGERRVAWSAAGSSGFTAAGSQGAQGQAGASGSASSDEAALKAQVGALTLRVQTLEGVLQGITNGDLLDAVNAVSAVESLCEQAPALAEQINLVQGVVAGLGLEPALELIGLLEIPTLPTALDLNEFGCSAP